MEADGKVDHNDDAEVQRRYATPVTMGSRMGTRITIAANASMNVPTMSKSTLMSIRMTILFSEKLRMARAQCRARLQWS